MDDASRLQVARDAAERMGHRLSMLLDALDEGQQSCLCLDFANEQERTFWDYTPIARQGLALRDMTRPQHQLVMQLLHDALSPTGYNTVQLIMAMEAILDGKEGFTRPLPGRDPQNYCLSLFGRPHAVEPWSWRFEGHHVSLHFAVANGHLLSPYPLFLGSNPAESALRSGASLRPLHDLEDCARALFESLDGSQRRTALLSAYAPQDILLGSMSRVAYELPPSFDADGWMRATGAGPEDVDRLLTRRHGAGVRLASLEPDQASSLQALVGHYLSCLADDVAEAEQARIGDLSGAPLHFAWSGSTRRREPHYYRIQAPGFLIEFDNYQNDANHIHSVWRDPANDFGRDALASHYRHSH